MKKIRGGVKNLAGKYKSGFYGKWGGGNVFQRRKFWGRDVKDRRGLGVQSLGYWVFIFDSGVIVYVGLFERKKVFFYSLELILLYR